MKRFLRFLLKSVIASLVAILMLILIVGILLSSAFSPPPLVVEPNSVLHLNLDHKIVDRTETTGFPEFLNGMFAGKAELGLNNILKAIEKAKTDDNIKGIYLDISSFPSGLGTAEEIRHALLRFKEESGKFVFSYNEYYSQKAYYIASVADYLYMNPQGLLLFKGLSSKSIFFKDALAKLKVEPIVIRQGKFKGAIEPFTRNNLSDENREQTSKFVSSIWDNMLVGMAMDRDTTATYLHHLAQDLGVRSAETALSHQMVDGLRYKDQVLDELGKLTGQNDKAIPLVGLTAYATAGQTPETIQAIEKSNKPKIAIVYASGQMVVSKQAQDGIMASEVIAKALRKARKDSTVKAIVLRINSGGGSATAAEVIWREVELAKKLKPVVVSMGDVAASGGYYIAAPASTILANQNTITGSIGVFGLMFNISDFLNSHLGIQTDQVNTNKYSDFGSTTRPLSDYEHELISEAIQEVYSTFITRVSDGRGISKPTVNELAQGRVWSGTDAAENQLIDGFGGLNEAITLAAEKATMTKGYDILEYPKQEHSVLQELMQGLSDQAKVSILGTSLSKHQSYIHKLDNLEQMKGIQTRLPFDPVFE